MTREERVEKLRCLITCMKCEESGKECDANCSVQYEAGNMGEIIENLEAISKALEKESCGNAISCEAVIEWLKAKDIIKLSSQEETVRKELKALSSNKPQLPYENAISRTDMLDAIGHGTTYTSEELQKIIKALPPVDPQTMDQWKELKETIIEMRDGDGTGTQQEVCKFLVNLMEVLEKQMQELKTGY